MHFLRSTPRRRARALGVLALAIGGLAASCSSGSGPSDADSTAAPKRREPARVRTAAVEAREMVRKLTTTTVVESENEIKVFPRASGVVTEVHVEEGDRVAAGHVLATLDRRHTRALVEEARVARVEAADGVLKSDVQKREAEARIDVARLKWEQTVREFDRNDKARLVSEQALDNLRVARDSAKNDYEAAQLAAERAVIEAKAARTGLEKAEIALSRFEIEDSYTLIAAPFAGVIASRSIRVGDSVGPSTPAFVLTDASNLRAVFHRPQRELESFADAARAPAGDAVAARQHLEIRALPEALPGVAFRAEPWLVSPSIDSSSGSFRVTVRLKEAIEGPRESRLLPGMLVRLEIVTERHPNALAIPKRALRREGESNFVYLVEQGRARKVEVDEGFADDVRVEVVARRGASLAAGARVIVVGNRELEDGAEVVEEGAAGPSAPAPPPAETRTTPEGDGATKKG